MFVMCVCIHKSFDIFKGEFTIGVIGTLVLVKSPY
jgi:hypothetical protein